MKINLKEILKWIDKSRGISKFRKDVQRTIITACVYQLWRTRNERLWMQKSETEEQIVQFIKHGTINRIRQTIPMKISQKDREWFEEICKK